MALRGPLGQSSGEVMREDAVPCERITRIFATVAGIGGVLMAWPLCHIHYGTLSTPHSPPSRTGSGSDHHSALNPLLNAPIVEISETIPGMGASLLRICSSDFKTAFDLRFNDHPPFYNVCSKNCESYLCYWSRCLRIGVFHKPYLFNQCIVVITGI